MNGQEGLLSIVTSLDKALKLHRLTHDNENYFLCRMDVDFKRPSHSQATFSAWEWFDGIWLCLFEEAEKEIYEDHEHLGGHSVWYGIEYTTTVQQALKRIKWLIRKVEQDLKTNITSRTKKRTKKHEYLDELSELRKALEEFSGSDEINLIFTPDWGDFETPAKRELIREYEDWLSRKWSRPKKGNKNNG